MSIDIKELQNTFIDLFGKVPSFFEFARGFPYSLKSSAIDKFIAVNEVKDINAVNENGYTAFELAMMHQNFATAYELLKRGALPLDYRKKISQRPIYTIIDSEDEAALQKLIDEKKFEVGELDLVTHRGKHTGYLKNKEKIFKTKMVEERDETIEDILNSIERKKNDLKRDQADSLLKYICFKKR